MHPRTADRFPKRNALFLFFGLVFLSQLGGCDSRTSPGGEKTVANPATDPLPRPYREGELWGYRYPDGTRAIPPQYLVAEPFSSHGIAAVANQESWWIIDRRGRKLLVPYLFDNGPDPFSQGLARFLKGGLIGYYDERAAVIIEARFDGAEPFQHGRARVCLGCGSVSDGEHRRLVGGRWFHIDGEGKELP